MSRRVAAIAAFLALVLAGSARQAAAVGLPANFLDVPVAGGLDQPVNFDFLPDGRILVVERATGHIRLVVPGSAGEPALVGTIPDVGAASPEQGLLGIAVDPRWPAVPAIYVQCTSATTPNVKVVRYALTGDLDFTAAGGLSLVAVSRREVLPDLPSDFNIHNGGTLEFGPDALLYVALGEDGIRCAAQDPHELRGKILRLDVSGIPAGAGPVWPYASLVPDGNPYRYDPDPRAGLVWHRGLRNPWTFDFDPHTGVMAIADVGHETWEEINIVESGWRNFGWPLFEGAGIYDSSCDEGDLIALVLPSFVYPHPQPTGGAAAIAAGICFAADEPGAGFPAEYLGDVFFLDFYDGRLRRLSSSGGSWAIAPPVDGQPTPDAWGLGYEFVPRMRFGADGGLWYVRGTELRRIAWQAPPVDAPGALDPPAAFLRLAAHPSPARASVTVEFALPAPGPALLDVFDAGGRRIRRLGGAAASPSGVSRWTWDGRGEDGRPVRPGVYFLRLSFGAHEVTRRIVLTPAG